MLIVLIPGLGADERIFDGYHFNQAKCMVISGIIPGNEETWQQYCRRLASLINDDDDIVLIGVSFGGMLALEIAGVIKESKVILISSLKTVDEKPRYLTFLKGFPIYKLLPVEIIKRLAIVASKYFTNKQPAEHDLFVKMLNNTDNRIIRFGIDQVVQWNQSSIVKDTVHIHGTDDRIFPIRFISADYQIKNGTHFMIIQEREKINGIINDLLEL